MKQQIYGIKEAAEILSVSFSWLDKKIRAGNVNHVMLGGKRMLTVEHIEQIKKEGIK